MRASLSFAIALLTVAWASPQPHRYLHEKRNGHGQYGNGTHQTAHLSGRPFPTAIGTAPHGLGNSDVGLESTVRLTVAPTPIPTPNRNIENIETTPAVSGEKKSTEFEPKFSAKPDTCNLERATVTYTPTVTVTVTQSTDNIAVSSSPIHSSEGPSSEGENQHTEAHPLRTVVPRSSATPKANKAIIESSEAPVSFTATPQVAKASTFTKAEASEHADTEPSEATTIIPIPQSSKAPVPIQAPTPTVVKASTTPSKAAVVPLAKPGNKRGILASGHDTSQLVSAFNNSPKVTWLVDWFSGAPPNLDSHIEFVPQNYGKRSDIAPDFQWTANAKKSVAKGLKHFLSFGEPETPNDLLHMEPQEAVDLFMKKMQPYANDVRLGAPSVTQPDRDLAWLSQFLDLCDAAGCSISFVCVHWIWSATEDHVQDFINVVTKAIGIAKGKPVWVDNFQATGSNAEQQNFLNGVMPWLEANSNVERYAYVSPARSTGTGFLNADGSISSLGEFYANF
jgi:hypothetical protein